ncbi:MAG TPA: zinc metalloprotease HtpX [Gemmatimonadaceae bacterium]|nr:zinc metalloprotease HtpX [Gemmatimonadaceae bacterium]
MFNNMKVFALMAGMTALLAVLGSYFGGQGGLTTALVFAGLMNVAMYFWSSKLVLRMYKARVVTEAEEPKLYGMVDRLRQRAELPMPTVAIAGQQQANAFATGRNPANAVVCVTEGLKNLVSDEELEGVIAHELAHIKNRDMLLQTVTATMAGAISLLPRLALFSGGGRDRNIHPAVMLALMILAPLAAMMIQMAISRSREFKADAVGAEICGRPLALAGALQKLEATARRAPMNINPAAAPLAQVNPLSGGAPKGFARWFMTHPPTEDRVRALQQVASRMAAA